MATYENLAGHTIEYPDDPAVAAFLEKVKALAAEKTGEELKAFVFGPENPILEKSGLTGRPVVTRKVLANPVYFVLQDIIDRAQLSPEDIELYGLRYSWPLAEAAKAFGLPEEPLVKLIQTLKLPAWKRADGYYVEPARFSEFSNVRALLNSVQAA